MKKLELHQMIREMILAEYEVFVDDDGVAYDDEGNSWVVGGYGGARYQGPKYSDSETFTGRAARDFAKRTLGSSRKKRFRKDPKADGRHLTLSLLTRNNVIKKTPFIDSILKQTEFEKSLSDKQLKIVRQIIHKGKFKNLKVGERQLKNAGVETPEEYWDIERKNALDRFK